MLNKYPLPITFLIAVFLFSAIPESRARPPTKWEQMLAEKKQLKREYDPQIRENHRKWEEATIYFSPTSFLQRGGPMIPAMSRKGCGHLSNTLTGPGSPISGLKAKG